MRGGRSCRRGKRRNRRAEARRRQRRIQIVLGAIAIEVLPVWLRTHRLGGNLIVRCRNGHLFTTLWIPGASVKALRLGLWRVQRCPVGPHWTVVSPVNEADLSEDERRAARALHDIGLP